MIKKDPVGRKVTGVFSFHTFSFPSLETDKSIPVNRTFCPTMPGFVRYNKGEFLYQRTYSIQTIVAG
ncbi:MAG: hypothetical protein BGO39_36190 [Chloroflexi bacterium 54-19]|nr:MAG: hypothetical protein BGO39_36190 [Chloroflexi bacterium 54-19]